jgi:hypothetical protein
MFSDDCEKEELCVEDLAEMEAPISDEDRVRVIDYIWKNHQVLRWDGMPIADMERAEGPNAVRQCLPLLLDNKDSNKYLSRFDSRTFNSLVWKGEFWSEEHVNYTERLIGVVKRIYVFKVEDQFYEYDYEDSVAQHGFPKIDTDNMPTSSSNRLSYFKSSWLTNIFLMDFDGDVRVHRRPKMLASTWYLTGPFLMQKSKASMDTTNEDNLQIDQIRPEVDGSAARYDEDCPIHRQHASTSSFDFEQTFNYIHEKTMENLRQDVHIGTGMSDLAFSLQCLYLVTGGEKAQWVHLVETFGLEFEEPQRHVAFTRVCVGDGGAGKSLVITRFHSRLWGKYATTASSIKDRLGRESGGIKTNIRFKNKKLVVVNEATDLLKLNKTEQDLYKTTVTDKECKWVALRKNDVEGLNVSSLFCISNSKDIESALSQEEHDARRHWFLNHLDWFSDRGECIT